MGPREEIARAIAVLAWGGEDMWPECRDEADAALRVLRSHGYITDTCLTAVHAEEDAAGEPRSTIERFRTKGDAK